MKLHLPKRLRAALLVALVATGSSYARASEGYTYDYITQTSDLAAIKYPGTLDRPAAESHNAWGGYVWNWSYVESTSPLDKPDMTKDWVMEVSGQHSLAQDYWYTSGDTYRTVTLGTQLIGNRLIDVITQHNSPGQLPLPETSMQKNDFILGCTANGTIQLLIGNQRINLAESEKIKELIKDEESPAIQAIIRWEYNEDRKTGSLYLTEIYLVDIENEDPNDISKTTVTKKKTDPLYTGKQLLIQNLNPSTSTSKLDFHSVYSDQVGDTSTTTYQIYAPGSGEDEKAWMVTDKVDVVKLIEVIENSAPVDTEDSGDAGDSGEIGDAGDAGDAGDSGEIAAPVDDPSLANVQFTGSKAMLYLYNPTSEELEFEYDRVTTHANNILVGDSNKSVGFGADENATLIVGSTALSREILDAGMTIEGPGVVRLQMADASSVNLANLKENSRLEIANNGDLDIDLAETTVGSGASITRLKSETGENEGVITVSADENQTIYLGELINENGCISFAVNEPDSVSEDETDDDDWSGSVWDDEDVWADEDNWGEESEEHTPVATYNIGTLRASGDVNLTGVVNSNEIESTGKNVNVNAVVTAETISATSGDIVIGAHDIATIVLDEENGVEKPAPNPVALNVTKDITAGNKLQVEANANVQGKITAGNVEVNLYKGINEDIALNAGSIETSRLGYNYSIITPGGSDETPYQAETTSLRISSSQTTIQLSEGASVSAAGIYAGCIAATDADAKFDIVLTNTDVDGETTEEWRISASELKGGVALAPKKVLSLSVGSATGLSHADTLTDVDATQIVYRTGNISAAEITGGTINLADNYVLSKARISAPASRAASGATVNVNGTGVQLNNLTIAPGATLTSAGSAQLNNVQFEADTQFGGSEGSAFTISSTPNAEKPTATLDSLTITGQLTGSDLNVDKLHIAGDELNFDTQSEYTLIKADTGASVNMSDFVDMTLDIQSWVLADVTVANGSLVISGEKDEEKFKAELADTANRKNAMEALADLDTAAEGTPLAQLHNDMGQLFRYSLSERQELLSAISGASTTALADSQRRGVQDVQHNLRNRVIQMGGGSASDWDYIGIQAWAQADGSHITTDGSGDENGYDYDTWGATVGANIDLTPNFVVGVSFSASYGELDVDSADKATGNNDAYYVSLFARHQKERWVQMLIITAGMNEMDMERTVGLGPNTYTGNGDTEGTTISAYYELGYTLGLDHEFNHVLQPLVSVSFTSAKVDGYSEEGSIGNAALEYDGDSYFYGTVGIGARYQGIIYRSAHERNAVLEARALITQDFGDTTDEASVGIGGGDLYKVKGADSSGSGFELGAGISLPVEQHTTLYADVDVTVRPDSTGYRANIGLRYDF